MDFSHLTEKVGISLSDLYLILLEIGEKKVSKAVLISNTGLSSESTKKFREVFSRYIFNIPNFFALNDDGKKLLSQLKSEKQSLSSAYEQKIKETLEKYAKLRPTPERKYDQFYSTSETQVARVKLLAEENFLSYSDVLFLGDDDTTSVCLAATLGAKKITVVDIDRRQLDYISNIAKAEGFKIDVILHDLREELPKEIKKSADIVFTDPPYTPDGFRLFLHREIQVIKNTSSTIYICYGTSERAFERLIPVQQTINDFSLGIRSACFNFNKYFNAGAIGSSSNLYVLKSTPMTKAGDKASVSRLYTYE